MSEPSIGYRIRQLRKQIGMTQVQLAEEIKVSSRQVIMWEMGHTLAPSEEYMRKLATVFGVTEGYLYAGENATDEMLEEIKRELSYRRSRASTAKAMSKDEVHQQHRVNQESDGNAGDHVVSIRMSPDNEMRLFRTAAMEGMRVDVFIGHLLNEYERGRINGTREEE